MAREERKRVQKSKTPQADRIMREAGGHGVNPLSVPSREVGIETLSATNQDPTFNVFPNVNSASVLSFAMGIILAAKKRGWSLQTSGADQYQALMYLIDVINSAMQGTTLEFTSAPRWFVEILIALRPKGHRALTGRAYYEITVTDTAPAPNSIITWGTLTESYSVVFGDPSVNSYNGFSTIDPAPSYNPAVGKEKFSTIWAVFPSVKGTPSELISPTQPSYYNQNDCSAFAQVVGRYGAGFFSVGGVNNFLENEVHIDSPILSRFASSSREYEGAANRAGFNYANGGGTACYLGPRCLEFTHISQFRNKARQVFKFYDFFRFYEVFSLIIGGVQERASAQTTIATRPYPLTAQQTAILLRQTLLPFFNNEMAQDLRFKDTYGSGGAGTTYLPVVVADNGVSQTALNVSPLMPKFFSEMVKGAMRLCLDIERKGDRSRLVMDWVPVLAVATQPTTGVQSPVQYTYSINGSPANLYNVSAGEFPMNIVDCSVVDGSTTYYLSLNGGEIAGIIEAHNEWMTEHQPFMTGLTKLTASRSSPLFTTIISTQVVRAIEENTPVPAPPIVGAKMQKQHSKTKVKGASVARKKVRQVNPVNPPIDWYDKFGAVSLNSSAPFLKELQKYQPIMISPIFSSQDAQGDTTISFAQSIYGEYFLLPYVSAKDQFDVDPLTQLPTLQSLHQAAADLDLKNISNSGQTEIEVILDSLSQKGQGDFLGILSSFLRVQERPPRL